MLRKNDERYPYEAIERILKDNNVKKEQITQVAVASKQWNPEYTLNRHYSAKLFVIILKNNINIGNRNW